MDDVGVIDQFTETFVRYIDSGFGFLGPDVAFLTTILIGIDITLAGLFWALSDDKSVIPALIKKVLYVGAFAFILNNFSFLADVIFDSFAGLGLRASNSPITADDLMRPGFVANTGFVAADPLLREVKELIGPIAFFENFVQIAVLMVAWIIVLLAFFILAIQLFITILEFKLTTLAGFVLVPFALWGKTAFLAERVLGKRGRGRHQADGARGHRRHWLHAVRIVRRVLCGRRDHHRTGALDRPRRSGDFHARHLRTRHRRRPGLRCAATRRGRRGRFRRRSRHRWGGSGRRRDGRCAGSRCRRRRGDPRGVIDGWRSKRCLWLGARDLRRLRRGRCCGRGGRCCPRRRRCCRSGRSQRCGTRDIGRPAILCGRSARRFHRDRRHASRRR